LVEKRIILVMKKNFKIIDFTSENRIVSVAMLAYNHENFIVEAIESVLMQKTDFIVQMVIAEDFSTDNTRNILLDYQVRFPGNIKLILQDKNVGPVKNSNDLLTNIDGKYIAVLECDDYWTDPLKLQKQVDFLDANPEYSLCVAGYEKRWVNGTKQEVVVEKNWIENDGNESGFSFNLDDQEKKWLTKTLTVVFQREFAIDFLLKKYSYARDIHLFYHLLKKGKGFYFTQVMGVYNIHSGGSNSMQQGLVNNRAAYNCYKELFEENDDDFTRRRYLFSALDLFKYSIYHSYEGNSFQFKFKLYLDTISLLRKLSEVRSVLAAFLPESVKNKLR
jgi:glycosyltransferase involved in cell wall biosynthesis